MNQEIQGKFTFDQDSKRYHRFQVETEAGVVGMLYIPKNMQPLPDKIVLDRAERESS